MRAADAGARDLRDDRARRGRAACTSRTSGSSWSARRRRPRYARPRVARRRAGRGARAAVPGSRRASCSTPRAWTTGRTSRGCSGRGRGCPQPVRDAWQLVMVCSDGRSDAQPPRAPRARGRDRVAAAAARLRARRGAAPALPVDRPVRVPVALRGLRAADRRGARVRRADDRLEHVGGGRAARARGALRSRRRRRDRRARSSARSPTTRRRAMLDEQARRAAAGLGRGRRSRRRRVRAAARAPAARRRAAGRSSRSSRRCRRPRAASPTTATGCSTRCASTATSTRSPTGAATSIPSSGRRARPTASRCCRCGASSTRNAARGGYDCVVYCLGNSEFHAGALAQLRRRSGIVLAHEVRLTDLYALSADEPGAVPGGFAACLDAMYDGLPPGTGAAGRLAPDEAERLGVLMAAEVVGARRSVRRDVGVRGRPGAARRRPERRRSHLRRAVRRCPTPVADATPAAARAPIDRELRGRERDQAELAARRGAPGGARAVPGRVARVRRAVRRRRPRASSPRSPPRSASRDRVIGDRRGHATPSTRRGSTAPRSRCSCAAPRTASRRRRSPTASPRARCSSSPASAPAAICPTTRVVAREPRRCRPASSRRSSPTCSTIPTAGPRWPRPAARATRREHSFAIVARAALRRRDRAGDARRPRASPD